MSKIHVLSAIIFFLALTCIVLGYGWLRTIRQLDAANARSASKRTPAQSSVQNRALVIALDVTGLYVVADQLTKQLICDTDGRLVFTRSEAESLGESFDAGELSTVRHPSDAVWRFHAGPSATRSCGEYRYRLYRQWPDETSTSYYISLGCFAGLTELQYGRWGTHASMDQNPMTNLITKGPKLQEFLNQLVLSASTLPDSADVHQPETVPA